MSNTQIIYTDLPGEPITASRQKTNLKVVLRNHRDIILDINTGSGGALTIHCIIEKGTLPQDGKYNRKTSFYCKTTNGLVNRGRQLSFKDGKIQHLYISREFEGVLTVRKGKTVIMKIPVKQYDKTSFSSDPTEKPAPIMIRMNKNGGVSKHNWLNSREQASINIFNMLESSELVKKARNETITGWEQYGKNSLMIPTVEILTPNDIINIPKSIWKHFGTGNKSMLSADVDEYGIISQNWIYNQIGVSVAFTADNWSWLKETVRKKTEGGFRVVKVNLKLGVVKSGEKRLYAYFSGYAGSYTYFKTGAKQLSSNPVVMPFTAGAGSVAGIKQAIKQNISGTFRNNALVYFILSSAVSLAEWRADQNADGYDLAGAVVTNIIKAVIISAIVTLLAGALIALIAAMVGGGTVVAIPAIIIGGIYVGLSILVGLGVEYFDKKMTDKKGISSILSVMLRNIGDWLKNSFTVLNKSTNYTYKNFDYNFCKAC